MPSDNPSLGRCPECEASIPKRCLLIEYETEAGDEAAFADCPGCDMVVSPEA